MQKNKKGRKLRYWSPLKFSHAQIISSGIGKSILFPGNITIEIHLLDNFIIRFH